MTIQATIEQLQEATAAYPSGYDSTKVNLSSLMIQNSGGGANNWVGPVPINKINVFTDLAATPFLPTAFNWSSTTDWLFAIASTGAATLKIGMWIANRKAGTASFQGSITATFPAATVHTARDMRVLYTTYSTGTVAVSGTAVTGTSTAWQTARFAAGARIGFGSTNPQNITTWFNISAITNDTSITLATTAGTISAGTAFVIEEIRLAIATTNATATNGGLQLVKGLNPSTFTPGGTVIGAAVSTDNVQAVYWLKDASTETNTTACGLGIDTFVSNTSQNIFVGNGVNTGNLSVYQYNIRAALTVASGADTTAFILKTGTQAVTGNLGASRSLIEATLSHGVASGVPSLFAVTSSAIVVRVPVANVTNGSTTFIADTVTLAYNSSAASVSAFSALTPALLEYEPTIDRLILMLGNTTAPHPVFPYITGSGIVDNTLFTGTSESAVSTNTLCAAYPNPGLSGTNHICACAGILYYNASNSNNANTAVWGLPGGADWNYNSVSSQEIITPSIATPNATKFYNVFVNEVQNFGDTFYGFSSEPFQIYARTGGIVGDSGAWTAIGTNGDLSSFAGANAIQFKFTFRTLGRQCLPARINNLTVVYESSSSLPGFYEWNVNDTNTANGTVGFTEIATISDSGLVLEIDYFREDTNANVLTQQSNGTTNGNFQYWNGSAWTNWTGSPPSPDVIGTRNRFVPSAGLPSGVNLYVNITQIS